MALIVIGVSIVWSSLLIAFLVGAFAGGIGVLVLCRRYFSVPKELVALLSSTNQTVTSLSTALASPTTRGKWGELQLERVLELAGMSAYCDFDTQVTLIGQNGKQQRPDVIVYLPSGRHLVVDSKAPLDAYLKAADLEGDRRREKMTSFVGHLKAHMQQLATSRYDQAPELDSPPLVFLFLPSEAAFRAALEHDDSLLSYCDSKGVFLTSPLTLIACLRAVAHCWKEHQREGSVLDILNLSKQLEGGLVEVTDLWSNLSRQLTQTVTTFNQATTALNSNVREANAMLASTPAPKTVQSVSKKVQVVL